MSALPADDPAGAPGGPAPGPVLPAEGSGNALPPGTMLGEFEVLAVAGEGGFAIVYRAWDHSLKRQVALKEYLPGTLAMRHTGLQVLVKPGRQAEAFWKGLESFVMEAQLLARFDHPALVKVFRFWEANGTAYMVMPFYEGRTLRDELRLRGEPPDEATLLGWLGPVADALAVIHAERWYHRDVAPDNVLLLAHSGRPLLLDFGAARQVIGDMTQALTVILKPGYAPIEQYTDIPGVRQGPWTDLYALAAVAHFAICGRTPPPSVGRMLTDSYQALAEAAAGRYSPGLLQALDQALSVRPEDRPQSVAEFKRLIGLHDTPLALQPVSQPQLPGQDSWPRPAAAPKQAGTAGAAAPAAPAQPAAWPAAADAAAITLAPARAPAAAPAPEPAAAPVAAPAPAAAAAATAGPATHRAALGAGMALALAGLGLGLWLLRSPGQSPAQPAAAPERSASAGVPPSPAPAAAGTTAAAPTLSTRWDVAQEFTRVVASQTPGWGLDVTLDRPTLRIGRDKLAFTLRSLQEGHVQVFQLTTNGGLNQLYPNGVTPPPRIAKGGSLRLPQGRLEFSEDGPAGTSQLLVLVSRWPRSFQAAQPREDQGFASFATDAAAGARAAAAPASQPLLAGSPQCPPSGGPCPDAYGATRVTFSVVP